MSQDVDGCKDPHIENFEHGHCHSEERNASSCQSVSTSGSMCCSNHAQACSQEKSNIMSNTTAEVATHQLLWNIFNCIINIKTPPFDWFLIYFFSFRNLTFVDSCRRWKANSNMSLSLEAVLEMWKITMR